jgi:hypothetical protein
LICHFFKRRTILLCASASSSSFKTIDGRNSESFRCEFGETKIPQRTAQSTVKFVSRIATAVPSNSEITLPGKRILSESGREKKKKKKKKAAKRQTRSTRVPRLFAAKTFRPSSRIDPVAASVSWRRRIDQRGCSELTSTCPRTMVRQLALEIPVDSDRRKQ